ncbi:MAG TPA: PaaI family thioesterase [Caulobacteraceae bacterium]
MTPTRDLLTLLAGRSLPTFRLMEMQPARFDPEQRRLSVSAHIGPEFADGRGLLRGGFSALLLDDVMTGAAILTLGPETTPRLVSQTFNCLMDAGPGEFTADGWVVTLGPTHCLAKAELRGPTGDLVVVAQGILDQHPDEA